MYKNINDYELLYLIKEEDEYAYNSMYLKYSNVIKKLASKIHKNISYLGISYDDIYDAGLYGLSKAIKDFDDNSDVLFYTCANTYILREISSFIRGHSRYKHSVLSNSVSLDKEIDNEGNTIIDLIENSDNNIKNYLEHEKCKKILDLKYEMPLLYALIYELKLNDFNNTEIVTLLDIKYKTLDNALFKIKRKLKKELNKIEVF